MVYRKRRTYRKKRYSRNRTYRRKFTRRTMRYNKRGQKVYLFKRFLGLGVTPVSNVAPTLYTIDFRLNQLPNYTEFTDLYDQYKINAVKLSFLPSQTQSISLSSTNNSTQGRFFSAIDYNDANSPVSIDELRQYQSCKWTSMYRPHKRFFRPKIQDRGASYTPGKPWINCTSPDQQYLALKVGIEPTNATAPSTSLYYNVEAKFYMSFKNVK